MVDALLLYGHVIGVVLLFVGLGLEVVAVGAASRADTVAELRLAIQPARTLPALMPLATLLMIGCGLALVAHDPDFHFGDAWVVAAIGIVVVIAVVGGGFSGRPATRLLDAANTTPDGPLPSHLAALTHDPVLLANPRVTAVAASWAIWLMSARPHFDGTLASLAVSALLSTLAVSGPVLRARPIVGSDVGGARRADGRTDSRVSSRSDSRANSAVTAGASGETSAVASGGVIGGPAGPVAGEAIGGAGGTGSTDAGRSHWP